MKWSDQMGSRGRKAWLLLINGEDIRVFTGSNIPGTLVVIGSDYTKSGKWSHTSYRLEIAPGVRAIPGHDGWNNGTFVEGLGAAVRYGAPVDTWADVANALGISVPSAMHFLRSWRPKAAETLDEVDSALAALDEAADEATEAGTETVAVSFGSPNRRMRDEGFWTNPKPIPGHNGELRLIDPNRGWTKDNIHTVGVLGTVISTTHTSGRGGGYVSVTVAIVPGTESEIPTFETARDKSARESGLPQQLFHAFQGDTGRVKAFMAKVAKLDISKLDEHEMSCGRDRKRAEVIRVSNDADFFLGADPLQVCWYITEGDAASLTESSELDSFDDTELVNLEDALQRLQDKFGPKYR